MRRNQSLTLIITAACLLMLNTKTFACSSMLVTKSASIDGSVILTYTCDGEFHPHLSYEPAVDYQAGDSLELKTWWNDSIYKIPRPAHTYAVVGLMNEHQLAIGETTFDGREELRNPKGNLHYWHLMRIALRRCKTAREAVELMTALVAAHGYASTGESFSIADTEEAWVMEMIGTGPGGEGAVWVALKIPDGYICAHANKSVINEFPLDDPVNCLYSDKVISFAIEKGYYDPKSGIPFSFQDAYHPDTPKNQRYGNARVWSIFRRAAPALKLSPDFHRAVEGAEPYPLWVKPDHKLTMSDVFSLMRDHYEGTDFDMTKGIDAGPYGTPNRWRPITFTVDSVEYSWERPVSTQQTGYSIVTQSRSFLPDPIGGVIWYAFDDTYTNCYVPFYCGINAIPESYTTGSLSQFSWDSAWWVFNFVANYANLKYSFMIEDIKTVQKELEEKQFKLQPAVEKTALHLYRDNPLLMTEYLTDYSVMNAELTVKKWTELGEYLITKYNDGYIQTKPGHPESIGGYPESWLREVIRARPEQFKLPEKDQAVPESKLVD